MILLSKSKVVHNWQTSNWLPGGPALTWKGSGKPILDFSRLVARCACYKVLLVSQGAQLNKEHSCIMCKKCSAIDFTAGIEQKLSWTRREPMITVPTLLWNIFIMFWLQNIYWIVRLGFIDFSVCSKAIELYAKEIWYNHSIPPFLCMSSYQSKFHKLTLILIDALL